MEFETTSAKTIGPSPLTLLQMPPELLVAVFSHLHTMEELCTVGRVCRLFAQLSRADCLWRPLGCAAWQKGEYFCWKKRYMKWLNATLVEWKALRPTLPLSSLSSCLLKEQEEPQMEEKQVRLSLVGTPGAGKTALMHRFALQDIEYHPDPFLNFAERDMKLVGGHEAKVGQ
ncbi:hypothetical protein QOT17_005449 [Balamuthia mandrillaris]